MSEKSSEPAQRPVAGMRSLALGAFCAFGVFAIAIGIGMSSVMSGKKYFLQASSETPLSITYNNISKETYVEAVRKISEFVKAAPSGEKLQFSLTADELNSLIVHDEQFNNLKGNLKVSINEDEITAETSWPLAYIDGLKGAGDGRFMNGESKYQVFVKKDELRVFFEGFYQQGKRLEVDAINVMQQINVLQYWSQYEAMKDKLNLVAEVDCKDDKLYFRNWKTPKAE